jgi:hypothetical protein
MLVLEYVANSLQYYTSHIERILGNLSLVSL